MCPVGDGILDESLGNAPPRPTEIGSPDKIGVGARCIVPLRGQSNSGLVMTDKKSRSSVKPNPCGSFLKERGTKRFVKLH